jgi:hypothetical protein
MGPTASRSQIHSIITHLRRHRLGDAFEGLLDIGDEMHGMVDKSDVVSNLPQLGQLFAAVYHHSAYGIYDRVDQVIHKLLYLSLRRCQVLKTAQTSLAPNVVGWLSGAQCEVNEHLEVFRNFLSYIISHPAGRQSQDQNLALARHLLQTLCPRINGLSRWKCAKEVRPKHRGPPAKTQTPTPSSASGQLSGIRKRTSPRQRKPPAHGIMMPTPPTQTADVMCAEILPTIPVERTGRLDVPLLSPDITCPLLDTLKPDEVLPEADGGQGLHNVAPPLDHKQMLTEEHVHQTCTEGGVVGAQTRNDMTRTRMLGFQLRPQHTPSSCCPLRYGFW